MFALNLGKQSCEKAMKSDRSMKQLVTEKQGGCKKPDPKKTTQDFFKKAHLKKPNKTHQTTHSTFSFKNLPRSKKYNKQDTFIVICNCFFQSNKQTAIKFKGLEEKRRI